ncbi:type II toxin-antitoxin system RelE/ParE family toxin [Patescibacteria group bacterium]|nr:type II toxin-antitoxin system RelE/ParE family toxin [Patescibacteria group bacterium]
MYIIFFERHFITSAKKLEKKVKEELDRNLQILEDDPTDSHLRLKPLHGPLSGFYSFRVKDYRVIIEFLPDKKIRILEIDRRDKIYK